MEHAKRVYKRTTTTVYLLAEDILALVQKKYKVSPSAKVSVRVPGGGDWSNTDLEIDDDTPITVVWEEAETE